MVRFLQYDGIFRNKTNIETKSNKPKMKEADKTFNLKQYLLALVIAKKSFMIKISKLKTRQN